MPLTFNDRVQNSHGLAAETRVEEFVRLLTGNERYLKSYILSLVPNLADAEQIAQETSLKLWEQFGRYDPCEGDFSAWARSIAHYQVLTFRKKLCRERIVFSSEVVEMLADRAAVRASELAGRQEALIDCLQKLPDHARELIRLYYVLGMKLREAAEALAQCSGHRKGYRSHPPSPAKLHQRQITERRRPMTGRNAPPQKLFVELQGLIDAAHRGVTRTDQMRRLEELLRDPEARDLYLELVWESDVLATWAKVSEQERLATVRRAPRATVLGFLHSSLRLTGRTLARNPVAAALLAVVAAVPLAAWYASAPPPAQVATQEDGKRTAPPIRIVPNLASDDEAEADEEDANEESPPLSPAKCRVVDPVARLTRTIDCKFAGGPDAPEAGDDLAPGKTWFLGVVWPKSFFKAAQG